MGALLAALGGEMGFVCCVFFFFFLFFFFFFIFSFLGGENECCNSNGGVGGCVCVCLGVWGVEIVIIEGEERDGCGDLPFV